jgi:hypothetical protein
LEGTGRKAGKEGRKAWKVLEGKLCGGLTAIGIAAPRQSAKKIIGYSIFSDYFMIDIQFLKKFLHKGLNIGNII